MVKECTFPETLKLKKFENYEVLTEENEDKTASAPDGVEKGRLMSSVVKPILDLMNLILDLSYQ